MNRPTDAVTTTQRFQSWELNGRGKPRGVWPLAAGLQPDDYTEAELDKRGQIVAVREYRDGNKAPMVRTFTLGQGGRLEEQRYVDPHTGGSGKNLYEYDGKGLMTARYETDGRDRVRYRIEVKCDSGGRFLEERILDHLKRPVSRHAYQHDDKGNVTRDEAYAGKALDQLQGFHRQSYDERGRMVRRGWHAPDGKEKEAFSYLYDEHDRRVRMSIEKDGKASMTSVTLFDEKGKVREVRYLGGDGKPMGGDTVRGAMPSAKTIQQAVNDLQGKLKEVARKDPRKLEALSQVAYAQFEAGRDDDARALFESLVTLDPGNAYYLSAVAAVALHQEQFQTALNYYQRALQHDPQHVPSMVGQGEALLRMGRVDQSLQSLSRALGCAQGKSDPSLRRARALVTALSQTPQKIPEPAKRPGR